jgi:hypothetical protein
VASDHLGLVALGDAQIWLDVAAALRLWNLMLDAKESKDPIRSRYSSHTAQNRQ